MQSVQDFLKAQRGTGCCKCGCADLIVGNCMSPKIPLIEKESANKQKTIQQFQVTKRLVNQPLEILLCFAASGRIVLRSKLALV